MRTILADDHRFFRGTLRRVLEELALAEVVAEASNGDEAVRLVAEHSPDVVLMDCQMPVLGGIEACRQIKRNHPQSKVILFSTFEAELETAKQLRVADGYVPKARLLEELAAEIDRVLPNVSRPSKRVIADPAAETLCGDETHVVACCEAAAPNLTRPSSTSASRNEDIPEEIV